MIKMKERKSWVALLMLLLLLAACKGETPTAPPPGGGVPPGGTTPPIDANLVLAASSTAPLIDSTVTITATATAVGGNPVANGTAVEFTTTFGLFTDVDPPVQSLIRTTTNGVATIHLTSSAPGLSVVTATVNNITRTININWQPPQPCIPPNPLCPVVPTITSVVPSVGRPQGGEQIRINGTNFVAPLKVLFDVGGPTPVEAFVVNSTETTIDVLTPGVNITTGQQLAADIIVLTRAGTANEQRASSADAFTFRNEVLTPVINSLTPASGPINGQTRVTIIGTGFQAPVQVFFGSAEAQVVNVQFNQIIVMSPDARSTSPDGSTCGTPGCTGPVVVRVVNINSNTRADSPQQFRYVAKMAITAISPLFGSSVGGTDVRIDGVGFDSPLQVIIGTAPAVEAQVIRVSGTEVLIRTPSLPNACEGGSGPITITNIENGDTATSPNVFTFVAVAPQITSTSSPVTAGNMLSVTVQNPGVGALGTASIRFTLGNTTIIPSPSTITSGTGSQVFGVAVPLTGFSFPTVACNTAGDGDDPGTQLGPVDVSLTFTNVTTGCDDTVTVQVAPPGPNPCVQAPPIAAQTAPATGTCAIAGPGGVPGPVSIVDPATGTATITFSNTAAAGAQDLIVTFGSVSGANASEFTVAPPNITVSPGASQSFTVTFNPAATGARTASASFTTNDPAHSAFAVCLQGTAVP